VVASDKEEIDWAATREIRTGLIGLGCATVVVLINMKMFSGEPKNHLESPLAVPSFSLQTDFFNV
jgi:hypothetical protein